MIQVQAYIFYMAMIADRKLLSMRLIVAIMVLASVLLGISDPGRCQKFSAVSPSLIRAGSFYSGADIRVHGLVHPESAVAIRVIGPEEPQVFNRRKRVGFIWSVVGHVTFDLAPSSYFLVTSGALPAIAAPDTRKRFLLGYPMLVRRIHLKTPRSNEQELVRNFIALKKREGLYRLEPGGVHLSDVRMGLREFESHLHLPSLMPAGRIDLEVLELRDGVLLNLDNHKIRLERVGLPGLLGSLAWGHPALFGFISLALALLLGLFVEVAAQIRKKDKPSPAVVLLKATLLRILESLPIRIGQPGEQRVTRMKAKFREFQTLLSLNNEVLELLTELEEESSWTSFRHAKVRMAIRALLDGSMDMVRTLNRLADDKYFDLETVVSGIRKEVTSFLENLPEEEETRLVIPLDEIKTSDAQQVGGKALNVARVQCDLKLRIPDSFVLTTKAYQLLMESNGLVDRLRAILTPSSRDDLASRSQQARLLIEDSQTPPSVERAIREAVKAMNLRSGEGLAVRSSAVGEDSSFSFAGQFESILNVAPENLPAAWKSVIASRYLPRAIFYRRAAGVADVDTPMAVLVQRMVAPRASGVLYTRRPDRPKDPVLLISSAWGIGQDVCKGSAEADQWVISRRSPFEALEKCVARKSSRLEAACQGGVVALELPENDCLRASLTDSERSALVAAGLKIDGYFGNPQDIEWAIDSGGEVVILQARPLRIEQVKPSKVHISDDATVLLQGGQAVWAGRAVGPVWPVESPDSLVNVPRGSILVLPVPLADTMSVLPRVCGVIVEHGSVTGHLASVLREFRIPSLFGLKEAMTRLKDGRLVSMDASEGKVFDGILWPELRGQLSFSPSGHRTSGLPRKLAERLTKLSGGMLMATWTCRSLHDVVRFSHEMAIQSMFNIGDELARAKIAGVKVLESSHPFRFHLIDLGGGLSSGTEGAQKVTPDQVTSVPFRALWDGLSDEDFQLKRLEDKGRGSIATVVVTTAFGGADSRAIGTPSYACLTSSYMNLNSRQAYHFAIVDAHVCDNPNSNHLSFRLKGGGAAEWQRVLRVRFMAKVFRIHHFTVSERGDLLNAWLRGLDAPGSKREIAMIGRMLRFCSQLDMWMSRPDSVQAYVEQFLESEEQAQSKFLSTGAT